MVAQGVTRKVVIFGCLGVALVTATAGIVVWQTQKSSGDSQQLPQFPEPSPSPLGAYGRAAVSCDAPICADIGKAVLLEGGNVVDSAIATLFCMGVIQTQSMGVGGGFLMVLYNATTQTSVALTAREKAPYAATENMYEGNATAAARGGLAVAVPGELKGYWEMYQRLGSKKVSWSRLVQPTIDLCEKGFQVSRHAANAINGLSERIKNTSSMSEIFVDKNTGELYKENDTMTRPVLAETFKAIAADQINGGNLLYMNNSLMWNFIDDLKALGGILEYEDMLNYTTSWSEPLVTELSGGIRHFTVPPPGSGLILSFILKLMDGYNLSPEILGDFKKSTVTYQRFIESMKHAYAKRTFMGDKEVGQPDQIEQIEELIRNLTSTEYVDSIREKIQDGTTNNTYEHYGADFYQPEDHGTSHVSIIGENGDAIAITSTVNLHFGAAIRSVRTGIIYNDEMDDFASPNITNEFGVPPSPNNFIMPGKRPVSSMAPSIFVDSLGQVRLVVGAAGGTQITTSIAYTTIRNLWLGQTIKEAIDMPRLHHQLYPMNLTYDNGFPNEYIEMFQVMQHSVKSQTPGSSVVVGVARGNDGTIYANSDYRKGGSIAGYD